MAYPVSWICQAFGQTVGDLFVGLIIDEGHNPIGYSIGKVFQTR